MRMIQRDLQQQLGAEIRATRDRIAAAVRPLDGAQLAERPEPNGWSVGEVLEHLCLSSEAYSEPTRSLVHSAPRDAGAPAREWKSSFLGGLIAGALAKPGKMKAPKAFRPGPTPRNGVLEAFLAGEHLVSATMVEATLLDWRALRMPSPALPFFFPKMNLGDAFRIYSVHNTRHAKQIERVAAQVTQRK
jgi:hypothetical protein